MKKNIYSILLTFFAGFITFSVFPQTFEIRTVENDYGYLTVQMRETSGTGTPTTSTNIVDITFVVRYPAGAVDISLICISNPYNLVDGLAGEQNSGGYDYHYWNASNTPFNCPTNWTQNVWEDIVTFEASGSTGSGLFEIAPNFWDGRSLNWNQEGTDYTPTPNGSVTYSYPTVIYDYVWNGSSSKYWDVAGNWEDACGAAVSAAPVTTSNCFIPGGLTNYPDEYQITLTNGQPTCGNLRIQSGATFTLDDIDLLSTQIFYTVNNNLYNYGTINLIPDAQLTVLGSTYIDAASGFVVQATSAGVGSFLDNGTITYGTNGSAKVQTYLSNAAGSGSFYIHLVGPTVDEATYTGAGSGAFLSAFNVAPGSTYAYSWDETVPAVDGWTNQYSNTYEVHTANGIALSTTDATDHTLNMTGSLMTGPITSDPLTFSNNHNEMVSNPYPSAVDFDALATANSGVVNNAYWMWDPGAGSYISRAGGTGGQQYIQVGQAFIVETNSAGSFAFTNTERAHSTDAFRDIVPNVLMVKASGGEYGFGDELYIRFTEEATSGYDVNLETEKWPSWYTDATQFWSVNEDQMQMQINALPLGSLNTDMVSVPVSFKCGYNDTYTFSFFDIESFEYGTDIWLEDKQTGEEWQYLNDNPEYTFSATPDDLEDRFVIHFFGPTGIDEFANTNTVDIYGYSHYAMVVNNTGEHIKNVMIFNLSGELMINEKVPDQKINKIRVGNKMGYYIVKVITDKNVYTEKILISYY